MNSVRVVRHFRGSLKVRVLDLPFFAGRMLWVDAARLPGWDHGASFYEPLELRLTEADLFVLHQLGAQLAALEAPAAPPGLLS